MQQKPCFNLRTAGCDQAAVAANSKTYPHRPSIRTVDVPARMTPSLGAVRRANKLRLFAADALPSSMSGCPSPFNPGTLSLLQGNTSQAISFVAPDAGSMFQPRVTVNGSMIDYDNNGDTRSSDAASFIAYAPFYVCADEDALTRSISPT